MVSTKGLSEEERMRKVHRIGEIRQDRFYRILKKIFPKKKGFLVVSNKRKQGGPDIGISKDGRLFWGLEITNYAPSSYMFHDRLVKYISALLNYPNRTLVFSSDQNFSRMFNKKVKGPGGPYFYTVDPITSICNTHNELKRNRIKPLKLDYQDLGRKRYVDRELEKTLRNIANSLEEDNSIFLPLYLEDEELEEAVSNLEEEQLEPVPFIEE